MGHLDITIEPLTQYAPTSLLISAHLKDLYSRLANLHLRQVDLASGRHAGAGGETVSTPSNTARDATNSAAKFTARATSYLLLVLAWYLSILPKWLSRWTTRLPCAIPEQNCWTDFIPNSVTKVAGMPDDALREYAQDPATAIVALTHDPRIDDMGLLEALTTQAFYIGAMGSSRTSAKRRERLLALGLTSAQIDRLHAPIGVPIGSKTPAEIAVSVIAEITAVRYANAARASG